MAKRSYFEELNELEQTWDMMFNTPPSIPSDIQRDWFKGSAFCVGSGGSVSLAKMWQLVYEHYGFGIAKTITPYEFFHTRSNADTVCLFSASGSNHDILEVFKLALDRNYRIFVVTNTRDSELVRLSKSFPGRSYAVYPKIDTPRDGFLAVNSVVSMSSIIYQLKQYFFNEEIEIISPITLAFKNHELNVKQKNFKLSVLKTTQIITSEWGIPAGIDLESRFAESGIGNCFLTDPRNFGHGRFLWLAKYPKKSQVIIFSTESSFSFVKRFNNKLPNQVPCLTVNAPINNILGSIYCIVRSILLFGEFAKRKRVDPGMPAVPKWGRNLHTLYYTNTKYQKKNKTKITSFEDFPALNRSFSAIVLDYDGTIVNTKDRYESVKELIIDQMVRLAKEGLIFGIATGRGFSAFNSLKNQLPEHVHESVIIGLYNGALIYKLSDKSDKPNTVLPIIALIAKLTNGIKNRKIKISVKPTMISIRGGSRKEREQVVSHIQFELGQYLRFVIYKSSGHSVDIFPHWVTKNLVIAAVAKSLKSGVLCIGDQGQSGGNDEEILNWVPSISVGKDRPSSNLCFWIGKDKESRESKGTLKILKNIMKTDNQFMLNSSPFKS